MTEASRPTQEGRVGRPNNTRDCTSSCRRTSNFAAPHGDPSVRQPRQAPIARRVDRRQGPRAAEPDHGHRTGVDPRAAVGLQAELARQVRRQCCGVRSAQDGGAHAFPLHKAGRRQEKRTVLRSEEKTWYRAAIRGTGAAVLRTLGMVTRGRCPSSSRRPSRCSRYCPDGTGRSSACRRKAGILRWRWRSWCSPSAGRSPRVPSP